MNRARSTTRHPIAELVDHMPIVILWRAAREALRGRRGPTGPALAPARFDVQPTNAVQR